MAISVKEVLTSQNWKITRVTQGYNGAVRIDAKTRFYRRGEENFFSKWVKYSYANRIYRAAWGGILEIDF
jgi:hypothetical protein